MDTNMLRACAAWAMNHVRGNMNENGGALYHDNDDKLCREVAKHMEKEYVLIDDVGNNVLIDALKEILELTDGSAFKKKDIVAAIRYFETC